MNNQDCKCEECGDKGIWRGHDLRPLCVKCKKEQEEWCGIHHQDRQVTFDFHNEFIDNMIRGKQKGMKYRSELYTFLHIGKNTCFEDTNEEYDFICKFGRGIWNADLIQKTFTEEDQRVVREIAEGYGAFDY